MTATGGLTGRGRRVAAAAWGLNILGVAHGVWAPFEFDPIPTSLVACLAASALAVVFAVALPGWFALFDGKARGARSLGALFLAPLIGLVVRAAFTVQLLRLSSDLVPAAVGAVAGGVGAGLWWLRFGGNWRTWPLMALLGLLVACALFEEIDQRLDHAAPQRFKVPVTDEFITRHKTTSYYLTLPPWGPNHEPDSVRVSSDLYQNVQPGQDVCAVLHPGFLGAAWYTVDICPKPPG